MKQKRRSPPEIEAAVRKARDEHLPLEVGYDEVTELLDVVLERAKEVTSEGTARLQQITRTLDARASGPGLRRVV